MQDISQKVNILDKKVHDEVQTISRLVTTIAGLSTKIEVMSETMFDVKTKVNLLWRGGLTVLAALIGAAWLIIKHHLGL